MTKQQIFTMIIVKMKINIIAAERVCGEGDAHDVINQRETGYALYST